MTDRTWRIDPDTWITHYAAAPNADGVRHAACGRRFRAIADLDAMTLDTIAIRTCRDCDSAAAIEHTHGLAVAL